MPEGIGNTELMARILVVEDEPTLLGSLRRGLTEEGYDVVPVSTIEQAMHALSNQTVDLILLDVMLPDGSGVDWVRSLRADSNMIPVLMATARDAVEDRITGLDSGADDYLVKPFSFDELVARLRALLRRASASRESKLVVDDLSIDLLTRQVTRAGAELDLTPRQFDLLTYFAQSAGEVVTREMIAKDVWKEPTATWTNVIEVQINHLRRRLERPEWPTILHTIRGKGYCLGKQP